MASPKKSAKKAKSSRKTKAKTAKGGGLVYGGKKSKSKPNLKKIAGIAGAGIATVATLYGLYKKAKASGQIDKLKGMIQTISPSSQSPSGMVQMESMNDLNRPSYYSAASIVPRPIYRNSTDRSPIL